MFSTVLEPILSWLILPVLLTLCLILGRLLAGPIGRAPAHSAFERMAIYWLMGVIALSWTGAVLAALGVFRPWTLCLALGGLIALVNRAWLGMLWQAIWRRSPVLQASVRSGSLAASLTDSDLDPTPKPVIAILLLALAISGWLFAHPAESFFLVDDSAVYTLGGVVLARTGSLFFQPEIFLPTADSFVRQFMSFDPSLQTARHVGPFFQWARGVQSLEIGFLPVPKVWTALAVWLFGAAHATWPTPLMGLTGLVALYGLARRLTSWRVGLATICLLAVSFPQIWFSRYPLSEAYTQALFLGGLYLAVLARQNMADGRLARWLAVWSGLSLAALTILRFEGALILLIIAALCLLTWPVAVWGRNGFARAWLATLALAGGYGLAVSIATARHYFVSQSLLTLTPRLSQYGLALLLALFAGGLLTWRRRWHTRVDFAAWISKTARWLPVLMMAGWGAWVLLALWNLRVHDGSQGLAGWLTLYWTLTGVALSCIGAIWLLARGRTRTQSPELITFLGVAVIFLLGYSANPLVNSVQPWATRRLVPIVFPAFALGAGWLLAAGLVRLPKPADHLTARNLAQWGLACGAFVLFLVQTGVIAQRSRPILFHREQSGLYAQLQSVADRLPPDAMLLFDNGQIGTRLPQAFELAFGHPALAIQQNPAPNSSDVDRLLDVALSQGRRVLLIITDGDLVWRPERWQLTSLGATRIDMPVLRPVQDRLPIATDIISRTLWLDAYEIRPVQATGAPQLPLDVPVGVGSYRYFREGFRGWVLDDRGLPIRWTDGDGVIELPWPEADLNQPTSACLSVEVAGGRPESGSQAHLIVEAEGVTLFDGELKPGYGPQLLKLPSDHLQNRDSAALQVHLKSNTWMPDHNLPLGVLVRGVELLSGSDCTQ